MPDIILVKQEMDYELTGDQVMPHPVQQSDVKSVHPSYAGPQECNGLALLEA